MTTSPDHILAAGGVVIAAAGASAAGPASRVGDGAHAGLHVLVVHRPTYDDWSLPKGHVDAGESPADAALREVAEETGVDATIVAAVGTTEHRLAASTDAATKRVHWYLMRPTGGAEPITRPPDEEVDRIAWWPVAEALGALTYAGERALLVRALELLPEDHA